MKTSIMGEQRLDYQLLGLTLLLTLFGLVMLSSASSVLGYERFGDTYFFTTQLGVPRASEFPAFRIRQARLSPVFGCVAGKATGTSGKVLVRIHSVPGSGGHACGSGASAAGCGHGGAHYHYVRRALFCRGSEITAPRHRRRACVRAARCGSLERPLSHRTFSRPA